MDSMDLEPRARGPAAALARLPTGAKVFLILVGALLPLALIALFTTIQTTRTADTEARARLRAIADESSGVLENALANQVSQMGRTLAALEQNPDDAASCTDESLLDSDLATRTLRPSKLVARRIKHFSGYMVAE